MPRADRDPATVYRLAARLSHLLMGGAVLFAALAMSLTIRARRRSAQLAAGFIGGAMLTSIGMNGPPIVTGLDGRDLPLLVGAAGLPLGWSVGALVFDRLSPRQFRSGMLAMLVLWAVAALASAT